MILRNPALIVVLTTSIDFHVLLTETAQGWRNIIGHYKAHLRSKRSLFNLNFAEQALISHDVIFNYHAVQSNHGLKADQLTTNHAKVKLKVN